MISEKSKSDHWMCTSSMQQAGRGGSLRRTNCSKRSKTLVREHWKQERQVMCRTRSKLFLTRKSLTQWARVDISLIDEESKHLKNDKEPVQWKWALALQLVASPVTPIDATADVYFFNFPGGTRKAEQVTAGRCRPRKCSDGRTVKTPEVVFQAQLPMAVMVQAWSQPWSGARASLPLKTSAAPAAGHLVRRNLQWRAQPLSHRLTDLRKNISETLTSV